MSIKMRSGIVDFLHEVHHSRERGHIRVLDIPPEGDKLDHVTPEQARAHFAEVGAGDASSRIGAGSEHAHMHRTETIDYGIVLEGELVLIVDEGETVCRAGDIIVQRGTNHGWANRTDRNCRIAFVLIDGTFSGDGRRLPTISSPMPRSRVIWPPARSSGPEPYSIQTTPKSAPAAFPKCARSR